MVGLRALYARVAPRYEAEVIPAFGPLASDLAAWIGGCCAAYLRGDLHDPFDLPLAAHPAPTLRGWSALDVGTGTGILARALADGGVAHIGQVIGADVSAEMLTVAPGTAQGAGGLQYLLADAHRLPVRDGALRLAVSSFGLNATTPRRVLRSLARALRPNGGLLIFQEWGALDPLTEIVHQTIADCTPESFDYPDAHLAAFLSDSKAWYDQLQDEQDFYEMLKAVGFSLVWVREAQFVSVPITIEQFIAYKLAWPSRRLPYEALGAAARAEVDHLLYTRLAAQSQDGHLLHWSPPLIRVCAVKG